MQTAFTFRPHALALAAALSCAAIAAHPAQAADTFTGLGTLGGTTSYAYAVSADGGVVVGNSNLTGDTASRAFRWTGGVMSDLGTLGGTYGSANGVSADGGVVAGESQLTRNTASHAFRWTGGVMSDLGTLGGTNSGAIAVSADGGVVVGGSDLTGNAASHAFRWTGGVMSDLGTLGGSYSSAQGVSADGGVVVGWSHHLTGDTAQHAFRWTQAGGMQEVAAWLAGAGVALPVGWTLTSANGVNGNGNVLVGQGTNPAGNYEAWLARVEPAGSGILTDIPAFNATLAEAGARAVQGGTGVSILALFGAHHRSLLDSGLARTSNGACGWATADAARHQQSDTNMELAEVGVCKDIGNVRFGLGVGQVWARQDWSLGGSAKYDGQHLIAEVGNAFGNGIEASVTAYYGRFDTEMRRHYLNGANVDASTGQPDAESTALRLRLDWKDVAKLGRFSLSPYAAYTWLETRLDAYTETGGGFPAQFAASKWNVDDLRLGVAAKTALSGASDLRLGLEVAHRLEGDTNGVNGQAIGLWSFSLPGEWVKQDWVRATVDVDHRLSDSTALTVGANAATNGGDASWGITAGLRANF
ncbi:MAG: autotransporter domain-containing protein [Pseudomonadota bacterium]|nr:autotransporter domain-containing protein [Pseudomonadota bacterium]